MAAPARSYDDLKTACIDEAMAIVDEQGLGKLSLREVARRLGVSHGAPYKHFPNRDHILAAIACRAYENFADYLEVRPRARSAHQDLHNLGVAYIQYAFEHPLHYRLMFDSQLPNPEAHPDMLEKARYAFGLLERCVDAVHTELRGPGPHESTQHDALFIWSTLHGVVGAMQSDAMKTIRIPKHKLRQAIPQIMARVKRGVFGDAAPPVPRQRPKLPF